MLTDPVVTPTTVEIDYIPAETVVRDVSWKIKKITDSSYSPYSPIENVNGVISDLQPLSDYEITCSVKYDIRDGLYNYANFTLDVKLPELEIKTLTPRAMNENSVKVSAETNLSSTVANAGFQWRKYEAPETLAPSEAFAPVYEGELQGVLKNLSQTSFYNVRAFYRSKDGKEYFGDWVTFDPSDFSYFEPTAHTYPAVDIDDSSALLRGIAIEGSDEIDEQGFEYWPAGRPNFTKTICRSANHVNAVLSSGQVMESTVQDLDSETTYEYRSYVMAKGKKYYGETKNFTTLAEPSAGIGEIEQGYTRERTLLGRYSLSGHYVSENYCGIVIEVYSDGSRCKILQNKW